MSLEESAIKLANLSEEIHEQANRVAKHNSEEAVRLHKTANQVEDVVFELNSIDVELRRNI